MKFNVGDKVKIINIKDSSYGMYRGSFDNYINQIGYISSIDIYDPTDDYKQNYDYSVTLSDGELFVDKDELELVQSQSSAIPVKLKCLSADAVVPTYATPGSACFDLYSAEDVIIQPGETKAISTGLAFEIPQGYQMKIHPRSGISLKTPLRQPNCEGIIDSDYRGEVKMMLWNTTKDYTGCVLSLDDFIEPYPYNQATYKINKGNRIAQAEIVPVHQATFEIVDELSETQRGTGGFGSSGV